MTYTYFLPRVWFKINIQALCFIVLKVIDGSFCSALKGLVQYV